MPSRHTAGGKKGHVSGDTLRDLPQHAPEGGARCEVQRNLMAHTLLPHARDITVAATLEMMRARCSLRSCIFAKAARKRGDQDASHRAGIDSNRQAVGVWEEAGFGTFKQGKSVMDVGMQVSDRPRDGM